MIRPDFVSLLQNLIRVSKAIEAKKDQPWTYDEITKLAGSGVGRTTIRQVEHLRNYFGLVTQASYTNGKNSGLVTVGRWNTAKAFKDFVEGVE